MKQGKMAKKLVAYICAFAMVIAGMTGYQASVSAADVPDGYTEQEEGWIALGQKIAIAEENPDKPEVSKWSVYSNPFYTATGIATKGGSDTDDTISIFATKNETGTDWGIQLVRVFNNLKPNTEYGWTIDYTIGGEADSISKAQYSDADGKIVVIMLLGDRLNEGEYFNVTSTTVKEFDTEAEAKAEAKLTSKDNIAKNKKAFASSEVAPAGSEGPATNIVDGVLNTRWIADSTNVDEYVGVNLGKLYSISSVALKWEGAYASEYEIQVSTDGSNYNTVKTVKAIKNETLEITFNQTVDAQYVRVLCKRAGTEYNYSIYEMGVFGEAEEEDTTTKPQVTEPVTDQPTEPETEDKDNILAGMKWNTYIGTWLGAYGNISQEDSIITATMTRAGGGYEDAVWDVQIAANNVAVNAGEGYRFQAKLVSTEDKKVRIKIVNLDDSEITYETIELKANESYDYSVEFIAPKSAIKIVYGLGASDGESNEQAYTLTVRGNSLVPAIVETTTVEERTTVEETTTPTPESNETTTEIKETNTEELETSTIDETATSEEPETSTANEIVEPVTSENESITSEGNETTTLDESEPETSGIGESTSEEENTSTSGNDAPWGPGFDPAELTYTKIACEEFEGLTIEYAVQYSSMGDVAPWYGDDGKTLSFQFTSETGAVVVTVNGTKPAEGVVTEAAPGIVKINPTLLFENAFSVIGITAEEGEIIVVVKRDQSVGPGGTNPTTTLPEENDTTSASIDDVTTMDENDTTSANINDATTADIDNTTEEEDNTTISDAGDTTTVGEDNTTSEIDVITSQADDTTSAETTPEETTDASADMPTTSENSTLETTTAAGETTTSSVTATTTTTSATAIEVTTKASTTAKVSVGTTTVKKVTKKLVSKKAKISLKKIGGAKYQIKVSSSKKFAKKTTVTKKVKKVTFTISNKKIQNKKVLYVKARAYKIVGGKTYYGKWSKVKKVKIKK